MTQHRQDCLERREEDAMETDSVIQYLTRRQRFRVEKRVTHMERWRAEGEKSRDGCWGEEREPDATQDRGY